MQLKTDKCNFIHLGRCVKSAALNIPHDSPWLIFPRSETPIISHEPNSTRMAQRSPRGQFSGHLPLTHHSCGNQPGRGWRDRGRRGGDGAAKRGWRRTYWMKGVGGRGVSERKKGWGGWGCGGRGWRGKGERGRVGMKREMERREGGRMEKRWRQWLDMDWGVVMVVWGLENIRGTERGWGTQRETKLFTGIYLL